MKKEKEPGSSTSGFDAVKFAREQKDKLSAELAKMSKKEIVDYFKKVRIESQIKPSS